MRPTRSVRLARIALALCSAGIVAAAAGCQSPPPPDPDGEPGQAVVLQLDTPTSDRLFCREGDCADWYRFQIQARGDLRIELKAEGDTAGRPLGLELADGRAEPIEQVPASAGSATLRVAAKPGYYMLRVDSRDDAKTPLPYEITAHFTPEPPPPKPAPPPPPPKPPAPKFRTVEGQVLEVEGAGGETRTVVIDCGQQEGIAAGQRGRLLEGDKQIATVEVVESYPEGSRVRIDGPLVAPVTAHTRAQIDVPVSSGQ